MMLQTNFQYDLSIVMQLSSISRLPGI